MARLQQEFAQNGITVQMTIVPGAGHEKMDMLPAVCKFLGPFLQKWWHTHGA